MKRVLCDWKYYNANSRGRYTGDCVIRAISLAYGLDYDEVHGDLLKLAKTTGIGSYANMGVFSKYLSKLGAYGPYTAEKAFQTDKNYTVKDAANEFDEGTYIFGCGESPEKATHLVCVIDGHIYDNWDSSEYYVVYCYIVSGDASPDFDIVDTSKLGDDVDFAVNKLLKSISTKMPYANFRYIPGHDLNRVDHGTIFRIDMVIDSDDLPSYSGLYQKVFVVKLNPKKLYEDQYKKCIEKTMNSLREWLYGYRKDIQDLRKMRTLKTHPKFHGSRELLTKFPDWIIPLVIEAVDNGANTHRSDRYEVFIEALPDDPRINEDYEVSFYANTIPELKRCFEAYRKDFSRFGYDY